MSVFVAEGIRAGYGKDPVIEDISFGLEGGELAGVLGANGCGKTTLLKAVCGILPHGGRCVLDGTVLEACPPRQLAKLCSYIPQRSGISIDISVLDVVLMGFNPHLGLLEHPNKSMREAGLRILEEIGLGGMEEKNYLHLSEGQKQLCILARTLVSGGQLLLLDEPESALDFRFRYRMLELLQGWTRKNNAVALVTLHDPALALNYCDKLLLMDGGTVCGIIRPSMDPLDKMEQMLSMIYGQISLQRCKSRDGRSHLVMLREAGS